MKLFVGSTNRHKTGEIQNILSDWKVGNLSDLPAMDDVEETGSTFTENAALKALAFARKSGQWILADDSGLEVDFLQGKPGVYSARFSQLPEWSKTPHYSPENMKRDDLDRRNNLLLIHLLQNVPMEKRRARYRCALALASPEGLELSCEGSVEGFIALEEKGTNGFGYDPLFYYPQLNKTFAELDPQVKNSLSHRRKALEEFKALQSKLEVGKSRHG